MWDFAAKLLAVSLEFSKFKGNMPLSLNNQKMILLTML